jgi:hypothetical protein
MMKNLPAAVMPLHDPDGSMYALLSEFVPTLKGIFSKMYLGVTALTQEKCQSQVHLLKQDPFFEIVSTSNGAKVGEQFAILYRQVAAKSSPDQILHLCYPDRVTYALQSDERETFIADVEAVSHERTPLIFHRSAKAWETHPRNYFDIEGFATTVGEYFFGKTIDFAWCHLVIQASQLARVMPHTHYSDISMVAEMILPIVDIVQTQDVDWLAWEDPFVLSRDASELKAERENDPAETQKRLAYTIPIMEAISKFALRKRTDSISPEIIEEPQKSLALWESP